MSFYNDIGNFLYKTNLKQALDFSCGEQDSIVFIDYCQVRDKFEVLDELGLALHPTRLHVIDLLNSAPGWKTKTHLKNASLITAPWEIFYQKDFKLGASSSQFEVPSIKNIDEYVDGFSRIIGERSEYASTSEYVDSNIIRNCIYTAFYFTLMSIRILNPKLVIIWNQYHPLSKMAQEACRICGVPVAFSEYGVLPGTFNFDFRGQMGRSAVAVEAKKFNALPIDDCDLRYAEETLECLMQHGLDRRKQPKYSNLAENVEAKAKSRPIIFFAGHNDYASGTSPYTEESREFNSPMFKSSHEAAEALLKLAEMNDWFLIYKPHPIATWNRSLESDDNLMMVDRYNIHECIDVADVTVTILSTTSYNSLIRGKPTVMLGYHQLRDKGCVYQIEEIGEIESVINQAYKEGLTESQRLCWKEHVARLLKYYLFRYGASIPRGIKAQDPHFLADILTNAIKSKRFLDFEGVHEDYRRKIFVS